MQYSRKIFYIPLLSIFCIFFVKNSFAQYPGMAAFRAQQTMQLAGQQMRTQMMMMQMMGMRGVTSSNEEFTFQVVMRDSIKKEVTSAIYRDSITHQRFIILTDKRFKKSDTNRYKKIYPF